MWYVGFRGESTGAVQNLYVYHDSGKLHHEPKLLPEGGSNPALGELRGFRARDGLLYVLNANKDVSQVLVYTENSDGRYEFTTCLASRATVPSIVHPYDLAFDAAGNCYVSSQDTNVVTVLDPAGQPLPVALILEELYPPPPPFLPGTIVASESGTLPESPWTAPDVPPPLGLQVTMTTGKSPKVANSVRDVLVVGNLLYVADEPAGAVKVYETVTGKLVNVIAGPNLSAPVQLLFDESTTTLYVGSSGNASVVAYGFTPGKPDVGAVPTTFIDGKVPHVSGMAFDANGHFYAALRKDRKILRFDPDGNNPVTFVDDLPDEPEFIRYVPKPG